jgi:GNAT superfamily N-acetyltransferase
MCIEPIADVQTIAVVPEYEGKGIGSALLRELISEGRRRGAADLLLEVRADSPGHSSCTGGSGLNRSTSGGSTTATASTP